MATRQGLFTVRRGTGRVAPWGIAGATFLGERVSMVLEDPRDGAIWAGLDRVVVIRTRDGGSSFTTLQRE